MKKVLIILFLLIVTVNLFAFSPKRVWINKEKNMESSASIYVEFLHKEGNEYEYLPNNWEQDFFDMKAWVNSYLDEFTVNQYESSGIYSICDYLIRGKDYSKKQEQFFQLPVKEQLEEIFKVFTITDENGKVILTLDTIDKATIVYPNQNAQVINIVLDQKLYE